MNDSSFSLNAQIKKEADEILYAKGLLNRLCAYGTPHVSGSYALDLMTWRDLDVYLEVADTTRIDFFQLGAEICSVLAPVKMSYRNELIAKTKGLPAGLYWGIYLGNERAGAWKIDLWAVEAMECRRLIAYCGALQQALTPANRTLITAIKSHCWQDPAYRKAYTSTDIYQAVLEHKVTDLAGFQDHLRRQEAAAKNDG